jgi:hypothetical protein
MIPIVPDYSKIDPRKRKAVFHLLKYMGYKVEKEEDIPDRAVFAVRLIPISHLLSALVVAKFADGYSYRQITRRFSVTFKEVRTIMKRHRSSIKGTTLEEPKEQES